MKIDKSLIILALQTLSEQVVNADISEHDESLDRLIRIKEQIKFIKEWKKQTKCSISGYIVIS